MARRPPLARRRRTAPGGVAAVAVLAAVSVGGCAAGGAGSSGAEGTTVVATTSIWADVAREVLCGAPVEVVTVVPAGADAHSFEPSLADRGVLGSADLLVANGLGLEEGLEDAIEAVGDQGVEVFEVGEHVPAAGPEDEEAHGGEGHGEEAHEGEGHGEEDHEGHDHGGVDPHIWNDPALVGEALDDLAGALGRLEGVDAQAVGECADRYAERLEQADERVAEVLAAVPEDRRKLVTSHDAFSYLARRYGFEVIGTVLPSMSSLAETNPAHAEEVADAVVEAGVPAVFAETQHDRRDADALARRLDGVEVVTLWSGTLGEPGSEADTYPSMLEANAQRIADALA
jgi:zinc/manganese transport system substrate-binding protein